MDNQYEFYKLTPTDDVEMGIYDRAMEYVFANEDIRNIAISGVYGAGKSSMFESYKKEYPQKKFIHISLAHFTSTVAKEDDNKEEESDEKREIALEGKIINQLVHQIDPQKVPLTNFRIKKDIDRKQVLKVSLLITAFIAITCFLRFKNTWENMINGFSSNILQNMFRFTMTNEMEFVMGTVALIILGIAIYEGVKLQKSVKLFKKLTFQGNEIEIFEESKDSYFDKYLNEVLYIFKQTGVDGIIFEDIDRYNTNVIFEKLREINFLLNSKDKTKEKAKDEKESKQVIRFFYLLRDDVFESKDRTKFFDFILPIVPVVDASNAYDKFIDYFKKANLLELFDMELVKRLSLYVDDMRVLKNICNEFIVYHEKLNTSFSEQGNSRLLAMIVYKNLFPKDFSDLQVGRGYVYTLFAEKKEFVCDKVKQLRKEVSDLQEESEQIKSEMLDDLDELNAIYFAIDGRISVDGKEETAFETRKKFVKAILQSENVAQYYNYGRWEKISIDKQRNTMEQNSEYAERKRSIEKKRKGKISTNSLRIAQLERQIGELEYVYLKDIITRENETIIFKTNYKNTLDEIEMFAEVKRSPYFGLIKVLIREGYLDETYPDYMTYFYENSITANDKTFIRSVTDRRKQSFEYPLNNAALVIERMRVIDFKEEEVLNFALLKELLSDTVKYEQQLQNFWQIICDVRPVEFVLRFLERNTFREKFVKEFNAYWHGANKWILLEDRFSLQQKRRYVADTLCVCDDEIIDENNYENEISNFIECDADFISVPDVDINIMESRLKSLNIRFKDINLETANIELLQFIYEHNMYHINTAMIQKMLQFRYNIQPREDVLERSLSIILSKTDEPLCIYVKENIDLYLFIILAEIRETDDTEEVALYVLNNDGIAEENLRAYIVSMKRELPHLTEVKDVEWWGELLKQDKVQKTVVNLCDYYFLSGNGLDDNLVKFVNGFERRPIIETDDWDEKYGESAAQKLFEDIIRENELVNDKYESIVDSLEMMCIALPQDAIAPDKLQILIDKNILEMNADTLAVVRKHYPEECMSFILKNIEAYVGIMNKTMFSSEELKCLLGEEIDDELKIRLLEFETKPVSIQNKRYSARVEDYIVEHLYCVEDFSYLLQWYPFNRDKMRECILNLAIREIQSAVELPCLVHAKLFEHLMRSSQLEDEDKVSFLIQQIKAGIAKGAVKSAFEQLELTEYKEILEGQSGKVFATEISEQILEALLKRKWIGDYTEDTNDAELFHVYGKAARKKKEEALNGA